MGTLVCTIELDKKSGVKVNIFNADDGITQTIQLDGTSVVITVEKGKVSSTYTQTVEKVAIDCKIFQVTASETITMTSKKAAIYQSSDDELSLIANKNLNLKSKTADLLANAPNIKAKADTQLSLALSDNKLVLNAEGVSVSSSAKIGVSGGLVTVDATGLLSLKAGGPASFKGAIANISGSLVNLG